MVKHSQIGFAVLLTKHPKGKLPRFATIGKTVLVRPMRQTRHWLKNMKNDTDWITHKKIPNHELKDGKVVRVRVSII